MNEIEPYKMYREYTKEEIDALPPLPPNAKDERTGTVPYMWDGEMWQWVMID